MVNKKPPLMGGFLFGNLHRLGLCRYIGLAYVKRMRILSGNLCRLHFFGIKVEIKLLKIGMESINNKILAGVAILAVVLVVVFYATKEKTKKGQEGRTDSGYKIDVLPVGSPENVIAPDLKRRVNFETADENSKLKIEEISKTLKTEKNNISLWIDLGSWRKAIGDYEGARLTWEYVVSVSPNNIVPLVNLGDLYQFYLKENIKAEDYMKRVIAKNPSYIEGYFRLYTLYSESYKEKIAEAPKALLGGLTVNPKSVDLMILLAQDYRDAGDKTNALIYYDKAISELAKIGDTARLEAVKSERATPSQ